MKRKEKVYGQSFIKIKKNKTKKKKKKKDNNNNNLKKKKNWPEKVTPT